MDHDNMDMPLDWDDFYYDGGYDDDVSDHYNRNFRKQERFARQNNWPEKEIRKMNQYKRNKYYVGAQGALDRNWGHSNLDAAIEHAKRLMSDEGREEVFVVQIIKVVKRKESPIEVVNP